jgi:hypothetical protein
MDEDADDAGEDADEKVFLGGCAVLLSFLGGGG